MADSKISALPASTTPLTGTEVLPIVQSSTTKQVSVANLTAGRAISATQLTLTTGNVIVANGQGVDFSATPGTGTSELLADYEEGTWTPSVSAGSGSITSYTSAGKYTKVGRQVTLTINITLTNNGTGGSYLLINNAPFTPSALTGGYGANDSTGTGLIINVTTGNLMYGVTSVGLYPGTTGNNLLFAITYFV